MTAECFLESQRAVRVSDGLIFAFGTDVSDEIRDAVTLTSWAAEAHAAHAGVSIDGRPDDWLDTCEKTLSKLGWVTVERAWQTEYEVPDETQEGAARRILRQALGDHPLVRGLTGKLQALDDWPHRPCWVGLVEADANGSPLLTSILLVALPPEARESPAPALLPEVQAAQAPARHAFRLAIWVARLNMLMFESVRPVLLRRYRELEDAANRR
ncbi:hypothetical protein CEW87_19280 [Parazoarcus communis]|uniref:Uncharacterized protein n=1 Tax=Parazoarcus communis TaxID=41977 RepID=A0A2U8H5V1_9RHOO|nr:hypothetical protein [Parazoarcus communis]AWI81322.1 hypothetical protein CEW87_19280 [Parazoarcus communis]